MKQSILLLSIMCRKEKNPKEEIVSRLKSKYIHILSGRLDRDVLKIANFSEYVLQALADPELIGDTNQKM